MRLLFVEDDEKLARAVTRGLRSEGFAVDLAADGDAALTQAAVYDYDVVVLDVMLPGRAEDRFRIVDLRASVSVPFGTWRGSAMKTRETSPLDPGVVEAKWYVAGIGPVREATLRGPAEHAALVAFHR